MGFDTSEWTGKGTTLSDKTARKEYGLTQDEIQSAIRAGRLQYRVGSMHGNPWLRLLRSEVEALVARKHGPEHLEDLRSRTDLARIARELKRLRSETRALEEERARLLAAADRTAPAPPRRRRSR